jgi:hypothetical protein
MPPTIYLRIQDDNDVARGVRLLKGEDKTTPPPGTTIQFSYHANEYKTPYTGGPIMSMDWTASTASIGLTKGNIAVEKMLAPAIASSTCPLHIRFAFCNISSRDAMLALQKAVEENTSLVGFSCFGNPADSYKSMEESIVKSRAPLEIWNNGPLPDSLIAQRAAAVSS